MLLGGVVQCLAAAPKVWSSSRLHRFTLRLKRTRFEVKGVLGFALRAVAVLLVAGGVVSSIGGCSPRGNGNTIMVDPVMVGRPFGASRS